MKRVSCAAMLGVTLSQLLGQDEVSAFLKSVVKGGRFANAYLFHGPAGVGKCTAAFAFARAMLRERVAGEAPAAPDLFAAAETRGKAGRGAAEAAETRDDACGACAACGRSALLNHPDLRFLFPVSGEEKELDTTIPETIEALRTDPLYVFQYPKAASIRLSLTRELLRELAYKPFESARRVVVVRDADRMREDQYSALLKSIEEPGASTVWMATQGFARFGRGGRESLRLMIEFHQLWLRDLLRARYGDPAREDLVHRDREAEIRKLATDADAGEIRRRLLVLEEVLRAVEGNVAPDVALFS